MKNQRSNKGYALLEGWLSLVLNALLFILKYWAGVTTGSIALIADAWHTLSDSLTSIVVLIGAKISSKPPDKEHPYGHGRAELVASIIIGVLLAVVGFSFLVESIKELNNREAVIFGRIALIATIVSIVGKEAMAQYALYASRKSGSKSIKADAWHHRTDALSSLVILVGIIFGKNFWWMDGVLGLIVSLVIFYTAYEIIAETFSNLIGEQASEETVLKIKKIIDESTQYDLQPHHLLVHEYGSHCDVSFHIKLPPDMQISKAHEVATLVEKSLRDKMDMRATIHIEPKTSPHAPPLLPDPVKPK